MVIKKKKKNQSNAQHVSLKQIRICNNNNNKKEDHGKKTTTNLQLINTTKNVIHSITEIGPSFVYVIHDV